MEAEVSLDNDLFHGFHLEMDMDIEHFSAKSNLELTSKDSKFNVYLNKLPSNRELSYNK